MAAKKYLTPEQLLGFENYKVGSVLGCGGGGRDIGCKQMLKSKEKETFVYLKH